MNNEQLGERGEIFHFTENVALSCHIIKKTMIRSMDDYPVKSSFSIMYEQQ